MSTVGKFVAVLLAASGVAYGSEEATVTSDQLEIHDNGQQSIFTGHVVLTQDPYVIRADRMVQRQADKLVTADGHIQARWESPKGEKAIVTAAHGRYDQKAGIVQLWGPSRVTVEIADAQGTGTFIGDRGWMSLDPKKARLQGDVRGHIIPGKTP